jgi:hypothetical protein
VQSDKRLKRYYNLINKKFFNNELPHNVCVRYVNEDDKDEEYNCEEKYYGWLSEPEDNRHKWTIIISKPKNPGRTALLTTLAHEMVHVATNKRDDHGPAFSEWHETLTARGLFRKSAVLKGLTLF